VIRHFIKVSFVVRLLRLGPTGVKEEIILNWIFKKWDGDEWTGLLWLRIGTGGGLLWMR
jgi:hypothetical protein